MEERTKRESLYRPYELRFDATQDYRREAPHFLLRKNGDLIWVKDNGAIYTIEAKRLSESDWIMHMYSKFDYTMFGEFVAAYLTALARNGIKRVTIDTKDFDLKFMESYEDYKKRKEG